MQDDANELVINVSLETDRIADIELASARLLVEFVTSLKRSRPAFWMPTPRIDAITGATRPE